MQFICETPYIVFVLLTHTTYSSKVKKHIRNNYLKERKCMVRLLYKLGKDNKSSDKYREVSPHGDKVKKKAVTIKIDRDEHLSPTQKLDHRWKRNILCLSIINIHELVFF